MQQTTSLPQPTIIPHESLDLSFPHQFDSTMLAAFDSCEIKGFRAFIEHWSSSEISIDLHAGGAFAAGMEATRNALWVEGLDPASAVEKGLKRIIGFWGPYEPPEGHAKSLTNICLSFKDYWQHYDPLIDPVKPYIKADGTPAVEFTFALPLEVLHPVTNDPILYVGRFDLLGYFGSTLYIIDEKTTGRTPQSGFEEQYKMRGQFLGYAWASTMSGYKVSDALVRVVVILKSQFKQLQYFVDLPNWQIERWYRQVNAKVARLREAWEKSDWRFSYGDACSSYGGCEFLPFCTARQPENWINDFKRRRWDPLRKDPTTPESA